MRSKGSVKKRIFEIIQIGTRVDFWSRAFDYFIVFMILLSISVTFMLTFAELSMYADVMEAIEFFTIVVFIIEYVLRVWTSDLLYPDLNKQQAAVRFIFSFYGLVELLTIVSYFGPLYSNGMIALRIIRVTRILRLFQLNTNSDTYNVVAEVLMDKKKQLLSSISMILMLMLAASLCMYGFEHEAQPDIYENAFSGIWWAMSTILTVGYGDIYPITIGGKIMAILIALLGVCVVAIPTGVISAGFVEYDNRIRVETILRSDKDGLVNREVIAALNKNAKRKRMSVNEYLLFLMMQDAENVVEEKVLVEKATTEKGPTKKVPAKKAPIKKHKK
ncbi:MAG: ion transporter [Lachnospiraceae bacterium]|nr:ion transporter [Lachnospiraceae bacterium]